MDFIKTYIKYVLLHRWNKLSEESINLLEQHWKNKPTKGLKFWLYKKIILKNNMEETQQEIKDKHFKDAMDKAMDYLYEYYETDHCLRVCVSVRTSEPWHDIPEELLTKEQFFKTLDERWDLAFNILSNYISKQKKK